MRRRVLSTIALATLVAPADTATAQTGGGVYPPINYDTFLPPAAGESYVDPTFGTTITRLSDALDTPNAADSGMLTIVVNEYSTMTPFNADGSRLLLQHQSYFALYDGDGTYLGDLPFEITAASEPRWSTTDPHLVYYVRDHELKRYDVATGEATLVRRFDEYGWIGGLGESDLSADGDHLVLMGDDRDIFVYQLSADTKGAALDTTGLGLVDHVYVTPDNNVLVGWLASGTDRFTGIELYDRDMNFLRQVAPVVGHMDVTRDDAGDEVLVWMNSADPYAPADCQNGLMMIRLADAVRTCLASFDWSLATHVSAPDTSGWVLVSTYGPLDPDPLNGWARYTNEILEVALDGSAIRRLAHHRSRPRSSYWWTPRAAVSRDGSRIVYSSNYGLPDILGVSPDAVDTYLIERPSAMSFPPGSQNPVALRLEQDHLTVTYSCPAGATWYVNQLALHSEAGALLATTPGCRATLAFTGTAVRWIGYRDEWSGIARVFVDGALRAEVDTYASPAQAQAAIHIVDGLSLGPHTLAIEVTGWTNPASGGAWVWVDAFEVVARHEETHPSVSYSCPLYETWYTNGLSLHSGGSAALAMSDGCQASYVFTGTEVSWIGYRDRWSGIARIYIDGQLRGEIDTYIPVDLAQAIMYSVHDLPVGPHTLTIEATGRLNPFSEGAWVWIDAFDIPP